MAPASSLPLFEIKVDPARNLARVTYRGHVTGAVMQTGLPQTELQLKQLKPGFAVLVDLSELESMDLDCGPHMSRVMALCWTLGVGKAVRVIPDPQKDIGINILSIIHYRGKVPIVTVTTLAEAEKEVL